MRPASGEKKDYDLYAMGLCGQVIGKSGGTARHYAQTLYRRGVSGIWRTSSGDFLADDAGLEAIKKESGRAGRSAPEPVSLP